MAGAHCATTTSSSASSFLLRSTISSTKSFRTLLPIHSRTSISRPRRPNTRKNYLRPKILKTIPIPTPYPHPILPQPPSQVSDLTLFLPLQKDSNFPSIHQFPGDYEEPNDLKIQEVEQFQASESSASVQIAKVGQFSKNSFLKFGLWLVGAFIIQTVCAIWVFNSADNKGNYQTVENEHERDVSGPLEMDVNGKKTLLITDEPMQKKIEEIRIMAREARDRERLERGNNGLDGNDSDFEDEDEEGFGRSGIEKEVNERLDKLREKLERNRDKILDRFENLKGDSVMEGREMKNGVDVKPGNEALVFKRKYKFKGSFRDQSNRPKGFSGASEKDHSKVEESRFDSKNEVLRGGRNLGDGSNRLDDDQRLKLDIPDGNGRRNVSKDTERRRQGRNIDVAEHKLPKVQDRNNGGPEAVTTDSIDPSIVKADEITNLQNRMGSNNTSGGRQQLRQSGSFKKPHSGSEWWEKLPYVLVILMQKSDDGDDVHGLYTLKSSSGPEGELSHIIAFQDRGDATNFCYLLQLYFEDLGDFSIDVVPLPMNELKEAMKSKTKRVIVVKKGELQLFAGQPISDVEVALRSLMEQD